MTRALLAALTLFCLACKTQTPEEALTEVLVEIGADELVRKAGDTLIVEVSSGPKSATQLTAGKPETFDLTKADFHWPATMALVASAAHVSYVFELNLRLEKKTEVLARGRVRSGFVPNQTLLLNTMLSAECLGKLDCAAGETCVVNDGRASCETASVDSGSLPRVDTPKSNDAGSSTKVDAGKPYNGKIDAGMQLQDAGSSVDAGKDSGKPDLGTCVSLIPEICDNGVDDDCDGKVDCGDPDCEPTTLCIPNAVVFALVGATEACPDGYDFRDLIYQDLKDPGCGGCTCQVTPKECPAYVSIYDNADTCSKDAQPFSAGTELKDPAGLTCALPIGKELSLTAGAFGFRVAVKESLDACTASGQAKPAPPMWTVTMKRCSAQLRRNGCRFGSYCAHTGNVPMVCRAGTTCEPTETPNTYFAGVDDKRMCDACTCAAKGGNCKEVGATMTNDPTCKITGTILHDGQKSCETIPSDAAARVVGKPRDPICLTNSLESGTLMPSSPVNLCCTN